MDITQPSQQTGDFLVANHGSICILTPLSANCRDWCDEHVGDDETQAWGPASAPGIVVEPRYINPILQGLYDAGFNPVQS